MRTALLLSLVLSGCTAGASSPQPASVPASFNPMASLAPLVDAVEPAVVNVYVTQTQRMNLPPVYQRYFGIPDERTVQGQGSGFVISPDGYILTNNHVAGDAETIKVKFADDGEYVAKVVGTDPVSDVALLKIDAKSALPWLKLGDSDAIRVGDWVMAVGNPLGLGHTVTAGIVSGKGRFIPELPLDDFLQTDASINPGNSGGPLVALDGTVVGMNTAIIAGANTVGFAIPSNHLQGIVQQLRETGKVAHGWLGVEMTALNETSKKQLGVTAGVLISNVIADGPAEGAGLRPGDVVLEIEGRVVDSNQDLLRAIATRPPGSKVEVTVLRDGKERRITVQLGARPESINN